MVRISLFYLQQTLIYINQISLWYLNYFVQSLVDIKFLDNNFNENTFKYACILPVNEVTPIT